MEPPLVERLGEAEYPLVHQLLVDLHLVEQEHYPDHPQLTREEVTDWLGPVRQSFEGENVILGVREGSSLAGICWCVIFDPGTGLEGEVAEVYVAEERRGRGVGEALVQAAIQLFKDRGVTLGYVWTRPENEAAVRLYRGAGFQPNTQLVLTWYPDAT